MHAEGGGYAILPVLKHVKVFYIDVSELPGELELTHRSDPEVCVTRLLLMSYFPSGFWSRLITRILADDSIIDIVRSFFIIPKEVKLALRIFS